MMVESMVIYGIIQKKCMQLRRREGNTIYSTDIGRETLNSLSRNSQRGGGSEVKGPGQASRSGWLTAIY